LLLLPFKWHFWLVISFSPQMFATFLNGVGVSEGGGGESYRILVVDVGRCSPPRPALGGSVLQFPPRSIEWSGGGHQRTPAHRDWWIWWCTRYRSCDRPRPPPPACC